MNNYNFQCNSCWSFSPAALLSYFPLCLHHYLCCCFQQKTTVGSFKVAFWLFHKLSRFFWKPNQLLNLTCFSHCRVGQVHQHWDINIILKTERKKIHLLSAVHFQSDKHKLNWTQFLSRRCFTLCITVEVEPRIAKQYKCQHCCSCKNCGGKGMEGGKKVSFCCFLADLKIASSWKKCVLGHPIAWATSYCLWPDIFWKKIL